MRKHFAPCSWVSARSSRLAPCPLAPAAPSTEATSTSEAAPATTTATAVRVPAVGPIHRRHEGGRRQDDDHRHLRRRRRRSPHTPATAPTTKPGSSATRPTARSTSRRGSATRCTAQFNGTDVEGDLTMNGVAYEFTAAPVSGAAGMYTADLDGVRASWVVRRDGSAIGVQFSGDHRPETRAVRPAATQRRSSSARRCATSGSSSRPRRSTSCRTGRCSSTINGRQVSPTLVTGTFRLT